MLSAAPVAIQQHDIPAISVTPSQAAEWLASGAAILFDIRTTQERAGGHPAGSLHVAWRTGPALLRNPRFAGEVKSKSAGRIALLICGAGRRSLDAAWALRAAGFADVYDVAEGCDGLEEALAPSGWKARGLPWVSAQ